jgi:hypothetical protein
MDRDQMEWDQDGQDGHGSRWIKIKMEGSRLRLRGIKMAKMDRDQDG